MLRNTIPKTFKGETGMIDRQGRLIDYVRISLTDRCNLRCIYCMPEEGIEQVHHSQILTYDEILRICRCLAKLGIRKIKLTGGEPLVRRGCASLLGDIKQIPGIEKVTLTTNGILLKKQIRGLAEAGLDAVNISLDTLNAADFRRITRRDRLQDVTEGIEEALKYEQIPVKVNCVPVFGDADSVVKIAELAKRYPLHVRFIEMMPIGYGKQCTRMDEDYIREILQEVYGSLTPCEGKLGNGPAHYFTIEGFQGKIGFISAVTHKFCDQCNRVRLTAEGCLKACLQYQIGVDLREKMRSGCSDDELTAAIRQAIENKPTGHNFNEPQTELDEQRIMSQIGG